MRTRVLAALVLALLVAIPAAAYDRGDVLLKVVATIPPTNQASSDVLIYKTVWPRAALVGFLLEDETGPAELDALLARGRTAPLRGGKFVSVAQLPAGARYLDALANDCTVLFSTGADARVQRMNICSGAVDVDFATLPAGDIAGAIRQLPGGDVLVAGGSAVYQFTSAGALLRSYPMNGVTHIALAPDGATFWAAGVDGDGAFLRHVDPGAPGSASIPLGNAHAQTIEVDEAVTDLVVVGEWRAAAQPIRARAAR
jgi:hypothetical protein